MLSDFFVAPPERVAAYKQAGFPSPGSYGFRVVAARGLDPVRLALLDQVVSGVSFDVALQDACRAPGQEPDLFRQPVATVFSERVVNALLPNVPARVDSIVEGWKQFEEMHDYSRTGLADVLESVAKICREAAVAGHLVLVWNCL